MNTIGYIVLVITIFVFSIFIIKKVKKLKINSITEKIGYVLLQRTYEQKDEQERSTYYGVFQQVDKEWILELNREQFLKWRAPVRGYLEIVEGKIEVFEL